MPNWCNNSVTFSHESPAEIQRLVTAYNENRLFQEFFPCPPELSEETPVGDDFVKRDEERQAANLEKYGFASWYEWKVSNWGTKWEVDSVDEVEIAEGATSVTVYFDSAWSPPIGFYTKMYEDAGFGVIAYYYEPGMAFCGVWEDGEDDEFEIDGDSDWVERHIPAAINEAFSISENMDMWEQEEPPVFEENKNDGAK